MLLEIGYVGRAHGLRGEVVVQLVTTVPERLAPGRAVECRDVQLVVETARPLPGKTRGRGSQWSSALPASARVRVPRASPAQRCGRSPVPEPTPRASGSTS